MDATTALHSKYRPGTLDEVIGHENQVQILKDIIKKKRFPNALLFSGPPSAGKTTMARAFVASVSKLDKVNGSFKDYFEMNAANSRTIEDMRGLVAQSRLRPMSLPKRFIFLDEAQQLLSVPASVQCFTGQTRVLLADTNDIPIAEIHERVQAGEEIWVLSRSETTGAYAYSKVTGSKESTTKDRLMKNGEAVFTPGHMIYSWAREDYYQARELVGETLAKAELTKFRYDCPHWKLQPMGRADSHFEMLGGPVVEEKVYDLEVEETNCFFVRTMMMSISKQYMLVHNCLLTPLESPPTSTIWMLSSMEPEKFTASTGGRALLSRCMHIQLTRPSKESLTAYARSILEGEECGLFNRKTLDLVVENCNGEMRTLANILQAVISSAGNVEGKLSVEQVEKMVAKNYATTDDEEVVAVRYITALCLGSSRGALKEILNVNDIFTFLMKAQALLRTVTLTAANGERHQKIWVTKPAEMLKKNLESKNEGRIDLGMLSMMHSAVTRYRRNPMGMFDLDDLVSLTGDLSAIAKASRKSEA